MIKRVLILLLLASPLFGAGKQYQYDDTHLNVEVENIYKQIKFPVITTGTAQNLDVLNLKVSTVTLRGQIVFKDGTTQNTAPVTVTSTDWAAYTPTITGAGTPTSVSFFWRQIGNQIFVKGYFVTGTVTAVNLAFSLPNSTVISSTHAAKNFLLGHVERLTPAAGATTHGAGDMFNPFYDGSDTAHVYVGSQYKTNNFVNNLASDILNSGDACAVFFDYPI